MFHLFSYTDAIADAKLYAAKEVGVPVWLQGRNQQSVWSLQSDGAILLSGDPRA